MTEKKFCKITLNERETDAVEILFAGAVRRHHPDDLVFGYGVTLRGLHNIFLQAKLYGEQDICFDRNEAMATLGFIKGRHGGSADHAHIEQGDTEALALASVFQKLRTSLNPRSSTRSRPPLRMSPTCVAI